MIDARKLTRHKNGIAAVELLDMAFNQRKVKEAFDRYVGPTYTQHNPQVPDGVEGAVNGIPGMLIAMPNLRYDFEDLGRQELLKRLEHRGPPFGGPGRRHSAGSRVGWDAESRLRSGDGRR